MAWRIYLKNPQVDNVAGCLQSTSSPMTWSFGSGNTLSLRGAPGEDWWYECGDALPELPGRLSGTVTKVTFVGAPPTQDIQPGMYMDGLVSYASVTRNGDKLKLELRAPSIEVAIALWLSILTKDKAYLKKTYE